MTNVSTRKHAVEVGENTALNALYVIGGLGIALGVLVLGLASHSVTVDSDPSGALAWQAIGGLVLNFSGLTFIGGLVAHAINWQIGRSAAGEPAARPATPAEAAAARPTSPAAE